MSRVKSFLQNHRIAGLCAVIVVLIAFSCLFITFARYALDIVSNRFFMTQNFYFSSNKLEMDTADYVIEHWSGTEAYDINITMQNTANLLVSTTKDIKYTVKCETMATDTVAASNVSCNIGGSNNVEKTFSKESTSDSFIVTMNYTGKTSLKENDSIKVKVTATSSDPYVKELSATFELVVGFYGVTYKIEDNSNDVFLTSLITNARNYYVATETFTYESVTYNQNSKVSISTYNKLDDASKAKCASAIITLTWDPKVFRLDTTSSAYLNRDTTFDTMDQLEHMDDAYYIKGLRFKMDPESSMGVKFYKLNVSEDYSYPDNYSYTVINFVDSVVES